MIYVVARQDAVGAVPDLPADGPPLGDGDGHTPGDVPVEGEPDPEPEPEPEREPDSGCTTGR